MDSTRDWLQAAHSCQGYNQTFSGTHGGAGSSDTPGYQFQLQQGMNRAPELSGGAGRAALQRNIEESPQLCERIGEHELSEHFSECVTGLQHQQRKIRTTRIRPTNTIVSGGQGTQLPGQNAAESLQRTSRQLDGPTCQLHHRQSAGMQIRTCSAERRLRRQRRSRWDERSHIGAGRCRQRYRPRNFHCKRILGAQNASSIPRIAFKMAHFRMRASQPLALDFLVPASSGSGRWNQS